MSAGPRGNQADRDVEVDAIDATQLARDLRGPPRHRREARLRTQVLGLDQERDPAEE